MKEQRFEKRTKKLEKRALQYIQKNEKLERHIAELQECHLTENGEPIIRNDDMSQNKGIRYELSGALIEGDEEKSEKTLNNEINAETKELNLNKKDPMHLKSKQPRIRSTKRCHLCRKRGHIQKECLFNPVFQNWS